MGESTTTTRQTFNTLAFANATIVPLTIAGLGGRELMVWPDANPGEMALLERLDALPDGTHAIHVRVLLQTEPGSPAFGPMAASPPGPSVPIGEGDVTLTVSPSARTALARRFGPTLAPETFTDRRELTALRRAASAQYGDAFVALRGYFDDWRVETDAAGIPTQRSTVVLVVLRNDRGECTVRGADAVANYRSAGRFETPEFRLSGDPRFGTTPVPCSIAER